MKLDRLTLEQLIQETFAEWTSDQSVDYGTRRTTSAPVRQKKIATTPPVRDAEKRFIDKDNKISDDKVVFLKIISIVVKLGMNILGVNTPEKM